MTSKVLFCLLQDLVNGRTLHKPETLFKRNLYPKGTMTVRQYVQAFFIGTEAILKKAGYFLLALLILPAPARAQSGGVITTVAGNGTRGTPVDGSPALSTPLDGQYAIAVDVSGAVYIAVYPAVYKFTPGGNIHLVAGNGTYGFSGDGGPATAAAMYGPRGLALDSQGNLYISDGDRVRKVSTSGVITTIAGNGIGGFGGDGKSATAANLYAPTGIAVDASGNLYIADSGNARIRKITPAGIISTIAGTGELGYNGDGGPATSAQIGQPTSIALDGAGNLYFADGSGNPVRKISPSGVITRFAGVPNKYGNSGDGGPATSAQLAYPAGLAADSMGNVYISSSPLVRKVTPDGTITTVAGTSSGFSGDGGPAAAAQLSYPTAIALDKSGTKLFIADSFNERMRMIDFSQSAGSGGIAGAGPAVTIVSPSNAQTVSTSSITVSGTATDAGHGNNGISSVAVNGGRANGDTAAGGNTANWDRTIALTPGSNTITVIATDNSSGHNATTQSITVTYSPPVVTPTSDAPNVGFAVLQSNGGQTTPAGLLVFSSVQNGIITSEAGVPASEPIKNGLLFCEFNLGSVDTGIAIANSNADAAALQLELWSADGSTKLDTTGFTLPGRHQIARLIDELFPDFMQSNTGTIRVSLIVRSSLPVGIITLRLTQNYQGEAILTTLPVTNIDRPVSSQPAYFPQIADGGGYATQLILQNPSSKSMQGSIGFYGQDGKNLSLSFGGQVLATLPYSIPPNGLFFAKTDGTSAAVVTGSAVVRPDSGQSTPSGTAIFSLLSDGSLVTEAAVPASPLLRHARIFVDYSAYRNTGVALTAPANVTLQMQLIGTGSSNSQTVTASLNVLADSQTAKFVNELFPKIPANFIGVLEISGNSDFAALTLRETTTPGGDALFTTLPVANPDAPQAATLIFPHLVIGGGYQTQIILVSNATLAGNPLTAAGVKSNVDVVSTGTISFIASGDGQPLPVLIGGSLLSSYNFAVPAGSALAILPALTAARPAILTTKLPDARVGLPYTAQLMAGGGLAPYNAWAVTGGTQLPPGLALNAAAGTIAGTPPLLSSTTSSRQDCFFIQVNDAGAPPQTSPAKMLCITTRLPALSFPLPPVLIPGAVVNQPYDYVLPLPDGGIGPTFHYQLGRYGHGDFGVFGGGFPPFGVTVTPDGHVSGRPAAGTDKKGIYTFNICAIDDSTGESDCPETRLTVIPPPRRTVTVTKAGPGNGTVTLAPPAAVCNPDCNSISATFPDDGLAKARLTAAADATSVFTGWTKDCTGVQTCNLLMSRDYDVVANFQKLVPVLITFRGTGTGQIINSTPPGIQNCRVGRADGCTASFPVGTAVNLFQQADAGSAFVSWTGCDEPNGQICIFTIKADEENHGVSVRFDAGSPVASFSWTPASPSTNQSVQFTDTSTGSPTSWHWTFGDSVFSELQNPTHSYSAAGTYTVTLTVTNAAGSNTTTKAITVSAVNAPSAGFTWAPASPNTNQSVQFTDTSTGSPASWLWDFGDSGNSTLQNPTHTYTAAGTYTVSLTVTNAGGSNTVTKSITIADATVNLAFAITSATCIYLQDDNVTYGSGGADYTITISGTGAGPVGSILFMPSSSSGSICGSKCPSDSYSNTSWGNPNLSNFLHSSNAERQSGQPAATSWSETIHIALLAKGLSTTVSGYVTIPNTSQIVRDQRRLVCQ